MAEYIEREAALDCFACDLGKKDYSVSYQGFMTEAAFRINDLPAADVRPVVLCRDCKHRFMTPNGWHCPYAEWGIEDDDFCSCAQKVFE